jgi:2-phosphosulfolactate phosphatase
MNREWMGQSVINRRFEWGPFSATALTPPTVVVVDVLRFTTAVEAGTSQGASIYPYRWLDDSVHEFARSIGAIVANDSDPRGLSLSPRSLLTLRPDEMVVLPSPNGSICSVLAAQTGATVVAACLRNASAIGRTLRDRNGAITVIACGELWQDGSLRPSLEDLLGAGAVLSHLGGTPSPEACSAIAAWRDAERSVGERLATCFSGQELISRGLTDDVNYASEVDASAVVPILRDGAFRAGDNELDRYGDE